MEGSMTTGQSPSKKREVLVAVTTGDPGIRFHDFVASWTNLMRYMKDRAHYSMLPGVNVTHNCNEACKTMLESESDYLWLIGDDHIFAPDIVNELMKHRVGVIVPHCLKRVPSFEPVIYASSDEDDVHTPFLDGNTQTPHLPERGLTEIHAAGTAGMLIHRRVLEKMEEPYFRTYGKQNEDLMFCKRVREETGEKIYVDPEVKLGHIGLVCVFPIGLLAPNDGRWLGWGVELSLGAEDANMNVALRRVGNSLTPA